jgi:superfamily II DNA or RNA helicase
MADFEAILNRSGVYIKISDLQNEREEDSYVIVRRLMNYFKKTTKVMNNYTKVTTQYKIVNDRETKEKYITTPRFGIFQLLREKSGKLDKYGMTNMKIINRIGKGQRPLQKFQFSEFKYEENQEMIVDNILRSYYNRGKSKRGDSGVILKLRAGSGKTCVGIGLIKKIRRKTLIVTHNTIILNHWKTEIEKYLEDVNIGLYYNKVKKDGDIVIGIINILLSDNFVFGKKTKKKTSPDFREMNYEEFFKQFGFIIFDETQEYCSSKRSKIFKRAQARYMLGLSATPDEHIYGFDCIAYWGIGEVLDAETLPEYKERKNDFVADVKIIKYMGHPEHTKLILNKKTDIVDSQSMINNIIQDPARLEIIVNEAKSLIERGMNIFLFADRKSYLEVIKKTLWENNIDSFILDKEKIIKVTGGASSEEVKNARENAQVILTTYQYMGTGFSISRMDSIILATPRKRKSKQYINRIFRLDGDTNIRRQIVDIVDQCTLFKNQLRNRKKYYEEQGYDINYTTLKYDEFDNEEKSDF